MRWYLVNIHRFYFYYYGGSYDAPIMPCLVASVTVTSFLGILDFVFNNGAYGMALVELHKYAITIPSYLFLLFFYLYYRTRLPNQQELRSNDGKWLGILLSGFSMIGFLIASICHYS